jgi:hypothetical protein
MPTPTATAVAYAIEFYLLVGLLFAIWFALRGAAKLDPAAANGSWGFRLLLVPQTIVIWPLALIRLAGGRGQG